MERRTGGDRHNLLGLGTAGLLAAATLDVHRAAAQAPPGNVRRTVLD